MKRALLVAALLVVGFVMGYAWRSGVEKSLKDANVAACSRLSGSSNAALDSCIVHLYLKGD